MNPPYKAPIAPKKPMETKISVAKSCEPNFLSLRAYTHMMAFATHAMKAWEAEVPNKSMATTSGSLGSVSERISSMKNWTKPMMIIQLLRLVPQTGTLSEIRP